jgi:hypothetical protein
LPYSGYDDQLKKLDGPVAGAPVGGCAPPCAGL